MQHLKLEASWKKFTGQVKGLWSNAAEERVDGPAVPLTQKNQDAASEKTSGIAP